ncbi:helix-turn-helix domain-containing protein [Cryobacterium lyxosi]|nr:helix-turn-helix domain-containing protein [Cryobacterium lyxosi]
MNTHEATSTTVSPEGLEPLMDVAELANYLGIPVSTVYDWRVHGKGPVADRFGKHLKFAISDVRSWMAQQREPSGQPDRR